MSTDGGSQSCRHRFARPSGRSSGDRTGVVGFARQRPPVARQKATSLTVTNKGERETAIQIRGLRLEPEGWRRRLSTDGHEPGGAESADCQDSSGASQVVRLILRQLPEGREATYRILIDQIPPRLRRGWCMLCCACPFRLCHAGDPLLADVQFHLERKDGQIIWWGSTPAIFMIHPRYRADGQRGRKLKPESSASPYILSGVTRRWRIARRIPSRCQAKTLQLTAHANAGAIEEQVRFVQAQ